MRRFIRPLRNDIFEKQIPFDYFELSPLIILIWGVISVTSLPVIQIASGFGWDGVFYGKVALDFPHIIGNIDNYHAGRIFPSVFIYYFLVVSKYSLTLKNVLLVYQVYNIVILVFASYLWVKITKLLALKPVASWFSFVALFINYPVLNLYFYYPSLTDVTALVIGVVMLYAYLSDNKFILLAVTMLSYFTWPTGILIGVIFFIYQHIDNQFWIREKPSSGKILLIILLLSPLFITIFVFGNFDSITSYAAQSNIDNKFFILLRSHNKAIHYSILSFISSLILIFYFLIIYLYLLKKFDFIDFFKRNIKKDIIFRLFISGLIVAGLWLLKRNVYNPKLPSLTFLDYAYLVIKSSSRYPFQFLICHISYWGPIILVLLIFIKKVAVFLKTSHLSILLASILTLVFSINAESRSITNFYPFIIFIVIKAIDFGEIKNKNYFIWSFLIISIFYSKVWLIVKLPVTSFPISFDTGLDRFPMQWYFMNFGLWVNSQMFLLQTIAAIIIGCFLYMNFFRANKNFLNTIN